MQESDLGSEDRQGRQGQQQADQEERRKDQSRIRTINMHLTLAELAVQEQRLTTPAQGSALHHYKAVLLLQNNQDHTLLRRSFLYRYRESHFEADEN